MVLLRLMLIAVGAFIAADAVNQWLVAQWRPEMVSLPQVTAPAAAPVRKRPTAYLHVARRNIFDANPSRPSAPAISMPTVSGPVTPVVRPLNLNARLTGTVVGAKPDQSYAFIIDKTKREETLYRVGDRIMDEAVVTEINRNNVKLVRGSAEQVLRMFEDKTKKPPALPRSGQPSRAAAVAEVPGNLEIDRNELNEALQDIPRLLTQARLLPNFRAGVTDGFRIFNIVPGSLFAKIGLKNGDVLHRINDVEIKDPTKFMGLFAELRSAPNITLDLVRGKDRKTFEYEIR